MSNETRTPAIDATTDTATMTLTMVFSNGETLTVQEGQLSPAIIRYAILHGLKQKLVDAAAISRNPDTGRSATIDDKYNAVREVYDRLIAGQWNKNRADGTGGRGGMLFRALCILYPTKTPEFIREFLATKSKTEQAKLRATPKVADIIRTLSTNDDDGDGDELLGELND